MNKVTKNQGRPEVGSPEHKQKGIDMLTSELERLDKDIIGTEKKLIKFQNESNPHIDDILGVLELLKCRKNELANLLADARSSA